MFNLTVDANIHNDKTKVEEVLDYLETLRAAWAEATVKAKVEATPAMNFENMAVSV